MASSSSSHQPGDYAASDPSLGSANVQPDVLQADMTLGFDDGARAGVHQAGVRASGPTTRGFVDDFLACGQGEYTTQSVENLGYMAPFSDFSDDIDGTAAQMHCGVGVGASASGVPFQDVHYQSYGPGLSTQRLAKMLLSQDDLQYTNGYTMPSPLPPRQYDADDMHEIMQQGPDPQEPVKVGKSIAKAPRNDVLDIRKYLTAIIMKPTLSDDQKLYIIKSIPVFVLNEVFLVIKPREGPVLPSSPPPPPPRRALLAPHPVVEKRPMLLPSSPYPVEFGLTEDNYVPLVQHEETFTDPAAPAPIYPAFTGYFRTGGEARQHRRRARMPAKSGAPDVDRVKRYGRKFISLFSFLAFPFWLFLAFTAFLV
jgi:hypothetical protein